MTVHLAAPTAAVFDCDGVILQSNGLKSDAFAEVLAGEGHEPGAIEGFVAWHKATGGVSRFHKFAQFYRETLGLPDWEARTRAACEAFGARVRTGLERCHTVPGLTALLATLRDKNVPMAVNTGGAEDEVRAVLTTRGLAAPFEIVLGSPATKRANMERLAAHGLIREGGVYFGDAALDWELARDFGLHFVFVAHESEWAEGAAQTREAGHSVVQDLREVVLS